MIALAIAAASIGFLHTLMGPDHYLPFVAMARSQRWSRPKTFLVTVLCGFGHIGSSVILGFIGIFLGLALSRLEGIEIARGETAAWALIAFGLIYFVWGIRKAARNQSHKHSHVHPGSPEHHHLHSHEEEHVHVHGENLTPWILFTIFVFGPCEPLIPLLIYPAAQMNFYGLIFVVGTFSFFTIATMLMMVFVMSYGLSLIPLKATERYSHALAGAAIFFCGMGIKFLGF